MQVICHPGQLRGTVAAIPAKSLAHRLLICASLADKPSQLLLADSCGEDVAATIRCLQALGAKISRVGDMVQVQPIVKPVAMPLLDCGASGSTLRFLLPVVAALGCGATFIGQGRLPQRPLDPLLQALTAGGISCEGDSLPLRITGQLQAQNYQLPGNISSQFISGLLLALPKLGGGNIRVPGQLQSQSYVEQTRAALAQFGIQTSADAGFAVAPGQKYCSPGQLTVEGDWSNMAFFLAAGALSGQVSVSGLQAASCQGDAAITSILTRFGAKLSWKKEIITVEQGARHNLQQLDISNIPDLLPILAVLAAFAPGQTRFINAARLRFKESDRLATVEQLINNLGGTATAGADYLLVQGKAQLAGGKVDSHADHRITMAAAIGASACQGPTTIYGAEAINKSYPGFFNSYQQLGGTADVID